MCIFTYTHHFCIFNQENKPLKMGIQGPNLNVLDKFFQNLKISKNLYA